MKDNKKTIEILHGQKILDDAECIWGWGGAAGSIRADRRADLLYSLGGLADSKVVLEIGCGTGEFTVRLIKKQTHSLFAVDISFDLLRKAKEKTCGYPIKFVVADAENLPFKCGSIDVVIGVSILHHLDADVAINEMAKVLRYKGRIVLSEPNMLNPQIFLTKNIKFIKHALGDVDTETACLRWNIRKKLTSAGFGKVDIKPFDFLHPRAPKFLIKHISFLGNILERVPLAREIAGSLIIFAEKISKK